VKRSVLLVGLALSAVASVAWASAPGVSGQGGTLVQVRPTARSNGMLNFGAGSGSVTARSGGSDYNAFVSIDPTSVTFESADAVSGPVVTSTSTSQVDITFTNDSSNAVKPVFHSTIVPAGLGFYLADTSGGCGGDLYSGCPPTSGAYSFLNLKPGSATAANLADASFDFQVLSDGVQVYDLAGSMTLTHSWIPQVNLDEASSLIGFSQATPIGSNADLGFVWKATPFDVTLPTLAANASSTLTYKVTVSSSSQARCINSTTCLVAYSGFGDPVGLGGGITHAVNFAGLQLQGSNSDGLTFEPSTFDLPQFQNGQLTFKIPGVVPEPGAWFTLLLGTALMGGTLRRARRTRLAA
jgi:hypothetical protein